MPPQTVTRSIESDASPTTLFDFLATVEKIPLWAPVFADTIEHLTGTRYRATKDGKPFEFDALFHASVHTVDYILDMGNGRSGGAYLRVTPRPFGGSSITMTVPVGPNTTEAAVAQTLEQELATLVGLV